MEYKMWILFLPLFMFAQDVAGKIDCDEDFFDQCQPPKLLDEIPQEMEVFQASCPQLLSYTQCSRDFDMKCKEEKRRRFAQPEKYADLYAFLEEICEEGTALNEVLATNLKCFNKTFSNTNCRQEESDFLKPYEREIDLGEFTTIVIPERVSCLNEILLTHCILNDITKNCGLRARALTTEFLLKSAYVDRFCPLHYREGLLEDIDEFNLTEEQKTFAISELERMKNSDEA